MLNGFFLSVSNNRSPFVTFSLYCPAISMWNYMLVWHSITSL